MTNPIVPDAPIAGRLPARRRPGVFGRLLKRPLAVIGLAIIALTVLGAIFAPWLTAYDPNEQLFDGLTLEGAPLPPNAAFWLGTDLLGRDLLTRILYGARTSLIIGVVANTAGMHTGMSTLLVFSALMVAAAALNLFMQKGKRTAS